MHVVTQFSGFYTPTCHMAEKVFFCGCTELAFERRSYNMTAQQIHTLVDFNIELKVNEVPLQVLNPGIIAAFTCVGVQ